MLSEGGSDDGAYIQCVEGRVTGFDSDGESGKWGDRGWGSA